MIQIGDLLVNKETKYCKVYYQVINIIDDMVYYDYVRLYSGPTTYSTFGEGKNRIERVKDFTKTNFESISAALRHNFLNEDK